MPFWPRVAGIGLLAAAVFFMGGCRRDAPPGGGVAGDIDVTVSDGWNLPCTVYRPPGDLHGTGPILPPGVLFLHDAGEDHLVWEGLARAAARAGFLCLACDFRGHGESSLITGVTKGFRSFSEAEWASLARDVRAAFAGLVKAGADHDRIAVVSAGIGGSVAMAYAADCPDDLKGVAIVSPGLELKSWSLEPLMARLGGLPLLLLATEGDSYAASTCERLEEMSEGFCEVRLYPGSSNGTDILALSDGAGNQIVQWLEEIIGEGHGAARAAP